MLGRAPVVDFDGTVASLPVDWSGLRTRLGVARVDDLWADDARRWDDVTEAERAAAVVAPDVTHVLDALVSSEGCAVLTSNSERAVAAYLDRRPSLRDRVVVVVGRETLNGPKTDFAVFRRGFARCVEATATIRGSDPVVYVGDQQYEVDFARRLGATAFLVGDLTHRPEDAAHDD